MRDRWMRRGLLALASVLGACSLNVNLDGAQFKCDADNPCPDGMTCGSDGTCAAAQAMGCAAAVGGGVEHSCAIRTPDGTAWCWGRNTSGQLGDGTTDDQTAPVQVKGAGMTLPAFTAIAGGGAHTCAIDKDGNAWCWGKNDSGQLGNNKAIGSPSPVEVVGLGAPATAIAAGDDHSCALLNNGKVACWGANYAGQLGIDGDGSRVPVSPSVSGMVTAIAVHAATTCAVTADKAMWCWGSNGSGQLGQGGMPDDNRHPAPGLAKVTDAVGVAIGRSFSCGLTSAGAVFCAGNNNAGQLGDFHDPTATPSSIALTEHIVAIAAGDDYACGLDVQSRVWCWGDNSSAELADGTFFNQVIPARSTYPSPAAQLGAGGNHLCVRTMLNGISCGGYNGHGQLGNGQRTTQGTPQPVPGLTGVASVASGDDYTCATRSDGSVQCWGGNDNGQLGDGTFRPHSRPAAVESLPGASLVATGDNHACALIQADGSVQCWGINNRGQLGDGNNGDMEFGRTLPKPVKGITGATQLAASGDHTCAVTPTQVLCWGFGGFGANGNGTDQDALAPVAVKNLPTGILGIAVGNAHACALLPTHGVMCWGIDGDGQLGDNRNIPIPPPDPPPAARTESAIPVAVIGLNGVDQISARADFTCAHVSADNSVWCWGEGGSGGLGLGSGDDALVPRALGNGTYTATDIIAGGSHTCARSGGTLSCWGTNDFGELGDGTYEGRSAPASSIQGLSNVAGYAVGIFATCAVSSVDGSVACWGDDRSGQLGDGVVAKPTPDSVQLPCL